MLSKIVKTKRIYKVEVSEIGDIEYNRFLYQFEEGSQGGIFYKFIQYDERGILEISIFQDGDLYKSKYFDKEYIEILVNDKYDKNGILIEKTQVNSNDEKITV